MSKKTAKPHFYEIGTGLDTPGKFSRRHILRCGKCDASVGFKALNDEQIRKKAINLGWDVGKTQTQHLCPKHAHAQKSYAQPQSIIQVHEVSPLQPLPVVVDRAEEFIDWFCTLSQSARISLFKTVIKRVGAKEFIDSLPPNPIPFNVKSVEIVAPAIPELAEETEPDPEEMHVADIIFGKRKTA